VYIFGARRGPSAVGVACTDLRVRPTVGVARGPWVWVQGGVELVYS